MTVMLFLSRAALLRRSFFPALLMLSVNFTCYPNFMGDRTAFQAAKHLQSSCGQPVKDRLRRYWLIRLMVSMARKWTTIYRRVGVT